MKRTCRAFLTLATACLLCGPLASPLFAKRAAPKPVAPLVQNGVSYSAVHERYSQANRPAGIRAQIRATDEKTSKILFTLTVYDIKYQPGLETDVQDVYITAISAAPHGLRVTNERGKNYLLDLSTKKVREEKPAGDSSPKGK